MSEKGKVVRKTPSGAVGMRTRYQKDENEDSDYRAMYLKEGGTKFKGDVKVPKNPFSDNAEGYTDYEKPKDWGKGPKTEEQ